MKHSTSWGKRAVAAAGVAALTLPALAGTAFAEGPEYNIDGNQDVKVTIHKYDMKDAKADKGTATGHVNDKSKVPADAKGLDGVVFTATQICVGGQPLDLTKAADWKKIDGVTTKATLDAKVAATANGDAADKWTYGADDGCGTDITFGATKTADPDTDHLGGVATSTAFAKSFYLVEETSRPQTVTEGTDPFLLTVPLANTDATTKATQPWLYSIDLFPKNTTGDAPYKKVLDSSAKGDVFTEGDTNTWQIFATVPAYKTDGAAFFTELTVSDTLDPLYGTAAAAKDIVVYRDEVKDANKIDASSYDVITSGADGQELKISFKADAKSSDDVQDNDKISYLVPGDKLFVQFTTAIVKQGQGEAATVKGKHTNTFTLSAKDNKGGVAPVTPGEEETPHENYGDFSMTKVVKGATNKVLAGAEFYVCKADDSTLTADDRKNPSACDLRGPDGQAGTDDDLDAPAYLAPRDKAETKEVDESATPMTFTSDAQGKIEGTLLIGEGVGKDVPTSGWYCLVEQTAPAGYIKDDTPKCFELNTTEVADDLSIENTQDTTSWTKWLPKTGAAGYVLLTLAGGALVAIAVGSALVIRRRQA